MRIKVVKMRSTAQETYIEFTSPVGTGCGRWCSGPCVLQGEYEVELDFIQTYVWGETAFLAENEYCHANRGKDIEFTNDKNWLCARIFAIQRSLAYLQLTDGSLFSLELKNFPARHIGDLIRFSAWPDLTTICDCSV